MAELLTWFKFDSSQVRSENDDLIRQFVYSLSNPEHINEVYIMHAQVCIALNYNKLIPVQ